MQEILNVIVKTDANISRDLNHPLVIHGSVANLGDDVQFLERIFGGGVEGLADNDAFDGFLQL